MSHAGHEIILYFSITLVYETKG